MIYILALLLIPPLIAAFQSLSAVRGEGPSGMSLLITESVVVIIMLSTWQGYGDGGATRTEYHHTTVTEKSEPWQASCCHCREVCNTCTGWHDCNCRYETVQGASCSSSMDCPGTSMCWMGRCKEESRVCDRCFGDYECCKTVCDHDEDTLGEVRFASGDRIDFGGCNKSLTYWREAEPGDPAAIEHTYRDYLQDTPQSRLIPTGGEAYDDDLPENQGRLSAQRLDPVVVHDLVLPTEALTDRIQHLNAELGEPKQIDIRLVLTARADPAWADALARQWRLGPKNGLTVVLGVDPAKVITWSSVFSLSPHDEIARVIQDELVGRSVLEDDLIAHTLREAVNTHFTRTPMAELVHLAVHTGPSTFFLIGLYLFTGVVTLVCFQIIGDRQNYTGVRVTGVVAVWIALVGGWWHHQTRERIDIIAAQLPHLATLEQTAWRETKQMLEVDHLDPTDFRARLWLTAQHDPADTGHPALKTWIATHTELTDATRLATAADTLSHHAARLRREYILIEERIAGLALWLDRPMATVFYPIAPSLQPGLTDETISAWFGWSAPPYLPDLDLTPDDIVRARVEQDSTPRLGTAKRPLRVSLVSFHGYAPAFLANGRALVTQPDSLFAERDVHVSFQLQDDIPPLATLFSEGDAHCAWRTSDSWAAEQPTLRAAGLEAKAVMVVDNTRGADAIVTADPEIQSIEDLASKRTALLAFTPSHGLLLDALDHAALTPAQREGTKLEFVPTDEGVDGVLAALDEDLADAAILWDPDLSVAQAADPTLRVLYSTAEATNLIYDIIVCDQRVLDDPEGHLAVARFIDGWMAGVEAANQDPDAAVEALTDAVPRYRELADTHGEDFIASILPRLIWTNVADNARILGLGERSDHYARVYARFDALYRKHLVTQNREAPVISPLDSFDKRFISELLEQFPAVKAHMEPLFTEADRATAQEATPHLTHPVMVPFATGSDTLDEAAEDVLDAQLVPVIESFGTSYFEISGHTDSTGKASQNQALSQARADRVMRYLVEQWEFPEARFTAVGYGSSQPLCDEANPEAEGLTQESCRALNRSTRLAVLAAPASDEAP